MSVIEKEERGKISLSEKLYQQVSSEEVPLEKLEAMLRFLTPLQQTIIAYLYEKQHGVSLRNIRDTLIERIAMRIASRLKLVMPQTVNKKVYAQGFFDSVVSGEVEAVDPEGFTKALREEYRRNPLTSRERRERISALLTKHKARPKPPSYEALRSSMAFLKDAGMVASISSEYSKADEFYNLAPGFFIAFDKLKKQRGK